MNGLEIMSKLLDKDIDSSNEDTRRLKNIAGTLYNAAAEKMDELIQENTEQTDRTKPNPPQGTLDFVKEGMSEYYRDSSGETQEELQRGLEQTQYVPEYDPYLKRDQINNNKENLKKYIDIKYKIDYREPEAMYPKKDKDSRIAQRPQQPQQTEFQEPDIDDSER